MRFALNTLLLRYSHQWKPAWSRLQVGQTDLKPSLRLSRLEVDFSRFGSASTSTGLRLGLERENRQVEVQPNRTAATLHSWILRSVKVRNRRDPGLG